MKKITLFFFISIFFLGSTSAQRISRLQQQKLAQTLSAVSNLYVDSINDEKLITSTIKSVLENLDPHSTYTPKEEVERMQAPLKGSFDGIGIQFQIIKDTINVVQTITGTPADKVGVLPADKIIFIADTLVAGTQIKNIDVLEKLRGKRGTVIDIKVKRGNQQQLISFSITRDKIPLHSVDASYMITPTIGYIKINNFGANTAQEFRNAFSELTQQGMKQLILDLQRNGGGYLSAAIELADEFLSIGRLIVYTEGEHSIRRDANATYRGDFEQGKLAILVDEYTASASEIVSGAIQDWDRGIIVGRRTFGKGLVQKGLDLIDGSIIRLTIARYYTPTGRSIQKSYEKGVENYHKDLITRYNNGELMHADSIHFPDSLKYNTLRSKRTVYGGGGIMPDIFVAMDTTNFSKYHQNIIAKGVVNASVITYLSQSRQQIKNEYSNFDQYRQRYNVPQTLIDHIVKEATKEGIEFNKKEFQQSKTLLTLQLKALIARNIWGESAYFQIINEENEPLQKAIEILQDEDRYNDILGKTKSQTITKPTV